MANVARSKRRQFRNLRMKNGRTVGEWRDGRDTVTACGLTVGQLHDAVAVLDADISEDLTIRARRLQEIKEK